MGLVIISIFFFSSGKILAVTYCTDAAKTTEGTCEYGECDDGVMKLNSADCESNMLDTTCCANKVSSISSSTSNCSSSDGKLGMCEFGECSNGLTPIQSSDCWLGRTCCALASSSNNTQTTTSNSNLNQNTQSAKTSSTDYQSPSLIKCAGGKGLCYNNSKSVEGSGCPSGVSSITDTYNDCGTANICCGTTSSTSCGSGAVCVDAQVICTNTINNDSCGGNKKCCLEKIPENTSGSIGSSTGASSGNATIYASQCDSNNKNCSHENDDAILKNQCQNLFTSAACASMPSYLSALTSKCLQIKPSGVDCATINSGGAFGNEASKFATYYIKNSSNSASDTAGAGGLDFDTIAGMGMPDSPGIKSVLVNILKWMLEIFGLLALIAFIISGGQYLLASGDEKMIGTAKKNMTYSIIGIIVALSGFIIIRAVDTALRATSTMF